MTRFNIQPESSTVNWTGKKVLGLHTGTINIQSGFIDFEHDEIIGAEIIIDMTTIIITDIADKIVYKEFFNHLNDDDFFAIDKFKTAKLEFTKGVKIGDIYKFEGNLTIKDITHLINFDASVELFTDFLHSLGTIEIDRTLYNIKYGSGKFIPNLGDKLIHDMFVLQFKLVGQK